MVFYRKEDGTPVALEDRCAHRHLPLSMGKLVGDTLQCHYHGLRYDATGACVACRGRTIFQRGARSRAYPVVERYRWLWIWMGDPALADPDKIPDFHWFDDPRGEPRGNTCTSRRTGSSSSTICSTSPISPSCTRPRSAIRRWWTGEGQGRARAEQRGGDALDHRCARAADLRQGRRIHRQRRPLADHRFRSAGVPAPRRRLHADRHRRAARQRVGGINMRNLNAITPETETTSHYFWGQAHDWDIHNLRRPTCVGQIRTAFLEDVAVFEAQQRNMTMIPSAPQVDINADNGLIQARRILDRLHQEEAAATAAKMVAAE